jgi:endoglycosylceramidase
MRGLTGAAALTLLLIATRAFAGPLHVDGSFIRDSQGGAVLLRGVNVAGNSKVPPFVVIEASDLDALPRWGMNVIRLLFNWEAYESVKGTYDESYLAYYKGIVAAAASRGIYVIADFHQDGFSRWSLGGCGEGFPKWAVVSTIAPHDPNNSAAQCADWGRRMASDDELVATWDAFYANTEGARAAYIAMVGRVAAALAGEPTLIGYDLLNEPYGDEPTQIGPLYADVAPVVRAADPGAILFISPQAFTSGGNASALAQPAFTNYVFSPHYYDPSIYLFHGWQGNDEKTAFTTMSTVAKRWGVPMFLGEYGGSPDTEEIDGYLGAMTTRLNAELAGAAQWVYTPGWDATVKDGWNGEDFSIVDDKAATRGNFRPRPYARRIAGTPTALVVSDELDHKLNTLELTWEHNPATGNTELYLPADYFGGRVGVHPDGDVTCTREDDLAKCSAATAGTKHLVVSSVPTDGGTTKHKSCGLTGAEAFLVLALARRWRRRRR